MRMTPNLIFQGCVFNVCVFKVNSKRNVQFDISPLDASRKCILWTDYGRTTDTGDTAIALLTQYSKVQNSEKP